MLKLNRGQVAHVRALMRSDDWDLIVSLMHDRIRELEGEKVAAETEFQYLRNALTRDGKITGLQEFFDDLEAEAFK